jgi:4-amino-4-deoxy-L-arabinose transferase-like glycosyltransferase
MIAALGVIGLTFVLGRELWSTRTGVFAAIVLAVSPMFLFASHDSRPEMLLILFMYGALVSLILAEKRRSLPLYFVSGLVSGLAADTHLNGVVAPFAIYAVFVARNGVRAAASRNGIVLITGWLLGWAWWIGVHVLPDPALFVRQWTEVWAAPMPLYALGPLGALTAEYERYGTASARGLGVGLIPLLAIGATGYLLLRSLRDRDRSLWTCMSFLGTVIGLMALIVANKAPAYAVLVWPIGCVLVARALALIPRPHVRNAVIASVAVLSLLSTAGLAAFSWDNDYNAYATQVRAHVPPGSRVSAQPTLWFEFVGEPFTADHLFKTSGPYGFAVESRGIEYIVADEFFLTSQLLDEKSIDEGQVKRFLRDRTTLVGIVEDPWYGASTRSEDPPHRTLIYQVEP